GLDPGWTIPGLPRVDRYPGGNNLETDEESNKLSDALNIKKEFEEIIGVVNGRDICKVLISNGEEYKCKKLQA
ncbi:14130_t:CDS:2, partial [Rhizophagus irregularis]